MRNDFASYLFVVRTSRRYAVPLKHLTGGIDRKKIEAVQ